MSDIQLERMEFKVPVNNGHLIGNTLRQFAMRGVNTWQPAAYRLASKSGSFGLSGGYPFSYLELLKGVLVSNNVNIKGNEVLLKFDLNGQDYVSGGFTLKNLGELGAPTLDVCLVFAGGARSAAENQNVVMRLCPQDMGDFVVVPSKHTPTIRFRYEVHPYDLTSESLVVEATPGCITLAKDSAVRSLQGLHI